MFFIRDLEENAKKKISPSYGSIHRDILFSKKYIQVSTYFILLFRFVKSNFLLPFADNHGATRTSETGSNHCNAAKTKSSGLSLFLYHKKVGVWKPASLKQKLFEKIKKRHTGFSNDEKIGSSCFYILNASKYTNVSQLLHYQRQCSTRLMGRNGSRVCK